MTVSTGVEDRRRPVRVLEVIGNGLVGGVETYVQRLIGRLPADRVQATCLCPFESKFSAALRDLGCDVFITPLRDDPVWQSLQFASQLVRTRSIDVIHAHLPNSHVLAGLVGQLTGTPALATVHGMNIPMLEFEVSRLTGTHLAVVSQSAHAHGLALGIPADRVTLIPNGVDTEVFSPDRSGEAFRRSIGVPLDAPLVGLIGRLSPEKNPELFVRMAWLVHRQRPDAHFVLVGEGPMRGSVEHLADHFGLNGVLHLAGLRADMPGVYPALDVVTLTSGTEGMPLALLEAMACARCIVATDVGGVAEIVEVGTTGQLVRSGDAEALAGWVLFQLEYPERTLEMGRAARRRVLNRFRWETSVELTASLFQLLSTKSGRRQRGILDLMPLAESRAAEKKGSVQKDSAKP